MRIRHTRSATKHRVSRQRSRYVVEYNFEWFEFGDPPLLNRSRRLLFLGDDADGNAVEVIAVVLSQDDLLVIHAMPLRNKFRERYEEAKWQDQG